MIRNTVIGLVLAGLTGCAAQDPALVGRWQGERNPTAECPYLAWTSLMTADGRFGTLFFRDPARTLKIHKRGGYWITRKNHVLFDAVGAKKYNVYSYKVIDVDTVQYTTITPNEVPGCRLQVYTEHRVRD